MRHTFVPLAALLLSATCLSSVDTAIASEPWDSCSADGKEAAVRGRLATYTGTASNFPRSYPDSDYSVTFIHAELEALYPSDSFCVSGSTLYTWGPGVGREINHLYAIDKQCSHGSSVHHTASIVGARVCSSHITNGAELP